MVDLSFNQLLVLQVFLGLVAIGLVYLLDKWLVKHFAKYQIVPFQQAMNDPKIKMLQEEIEMNKPRFGSKWPDGDAKDRTPGSKKPGDIDIISREDVRPSI